jgi:hypothetical protein
MKEKGYRRAKLKMPDGTYLDHWVPETAGRNIDVLAQGFWNWLPQVMALSALNSHTLFCRRILASQDDGRVLLHECHRTASQRFLGIFHCRRCNRSLAIRLSVLFPLTMAL